MKEITKELSISVACLLDSATFNNVVLVEVQDIEHIQNMVTKLENIVEGKN